MKKTGKFRQTVAAFMATMAMVGAPPTEARVIENTNSAKEISNPNKNAVTPPKEQGQGIKLNDHTGGMDFDFTRMHQEANPIYIPYYHPKQSYRAQVRKAKKRRK